VRAPKEMQMDRRTESDVQATGSFRALTDALATAGDTPTPPDRPEWVEQAREAVEEPGRYLAFEDDGTPRVVPLAREWTRVGRSLSADVRFDDATVSRRHALIVCQADGVRVLDDRSLNGVYVNGRRVEWSALRDGDRIAVGRHTLWFLDTSGVPASETAAGASASG
jgi:pSer/pThr/pTyr-binding forkhead associated (FHA) protein